MSSQLPSKPPFPGCQTQWGCAGCAVNYTTCSLFCMLEEQLFILLWNQTRHSTHVLHRAELEFEVKFCSNLSNLILHQGNLFREQMRQNLGWGYVGAGDQRVGPVVVKIRSLTSPFWQRSRADMAGHQLVKLASVILFNWPFKTCGPGWHTGVWTIREPRVQGVDAPWHAGKADTVGSAADSWRSRQPQSARKTSAGNLQKTVFSAQKKKEM